MKYVIKKEEPKVIKTFESFVGNLNTNKYDGLENISKPNDGIGGEVDSATRNKVLDVNNFNEWLSNSFTGYGYRNGAPDLIGRSDKLSKAMLVSYFLDQGVECNEKEILDFTDVIRKGWGK